MGGISGSSGSNRSVDDPNLQPDRYVVGVPAPVNGGMDVELVDALPGRCEARAMEMSVCIENAGVMDVTLEQVTL